MRTRRCVLASCWTLFAAAGCYSPNFESAADAGEAGESTGPSSTSGETTMSSSADGSTSATGPADSTGEGTSTSQVTDGTGAADPTSESAEDSSESASGSSGEPADPYCGDLNIDPGEDCDNGQANALDAECRPDCTLASCGDGDIWVGGEACDDGADDNALQVGACAPDCSRVIEERVLRLGESFSGGDLGANPIAFVDSHCAVGELAMFAYPGLREAAVNSFDTSGSIDWVLEPYTAYVRENGLLLWITDDVPLLGVRDGGQLSLLASVVNECPEGFICLEGRAITGLETGWTTSTVDDCESWTSSSTNDVARRGYGSSQTTFLYDPAYTTDCQWPMDTQVYCVEQ